MSSGEQLNPPLQLFPLSLDVARRAIADFYPLRKVPEELRRIQTTIDEEIALIRGTDEEPGENPNVWEFMRLMSAYLNNSPSISALRVGMLAFYHATKIKAETTKISLPTISEEQLGKYFLKRNLDWKGDEITTYKGDFNWAEVFATFQTEEEGFMAGLREQNITSVPDYPSFGFGCALMQDLLKTAPNL